MPNENKKQLTKGFKNNKKKIKPTKKLEISNHDIIYQNALNKKKTN